MTARDVGTQERRQRPFRRLNRSSSANREPQANPATLQATIDTANAAAQSAADAAASNKQPVNRLRLNRMTRQRMKRISVPTPPCGANEVGLRQHVTLAIMGTSSGSTGSTTEQVLTPSRKPPSTTARVGPRRTCNAIPTGSHRNSSRMTRPTTRRIAGRRVSCRSCAAAANTSAAAAASAAATARTSADA